MKNIRIGVVIVALGYAGFVILNPERYSEIKFTTALVTFIGALLAHIWADT